MDVLFGVILIYKQIIECEFETKLYVFCSYVV
jgi:hypothetical protein